MNNKKRNWMVVTIIAFLFVFMLAKTSKADEYDENNQFKFGVEVLLDEQKDLLKGKRVGLVTNPTGVNQELESDVDLLFNDPDINLTALYGPEHGVRGNEEAGGYVESYIDPETNLPVYSLYGKTQKPSDEMLEDVDVLLFDIQDAGVTYYTYVWTLYYVLEAASENDKEVIILDRPNPLGGQRVEGPVTVEDGNSSFVGLKDLALIHGMTFGEIAEYFDDAFNLDANVSVVKMDNYDRSKRYDDLDVPFVMPSPNIPTTDTANVYPMTGFFETFSNVSEGRGTTKPFQLVGAEFVNSTAYAKHLNELAMPGVKFRAATFTPAPGQKVAGKLAQGVEVYISDLDNYDPIYTGLSMMKVLNDDYGDQVEWREDGWLAKLTGKSYVEEDLKNGVEVGEIIQKWQPELEEFKETRERYLLYGHEGTVDKSALEKLINQANDLTEEDYLPESYKVLQEKLKEAQMVLDDDEANQYATDKAASALQEAIDGLEEKKEVEKIVLNVSGIKTLKKGKEFQLETTVTPSDAYVGTLSYESNHPEIAKVDENGLVTAIKAGTAKITVTTENGKKASFTLRVTK